MSTNVAVAEKKKINLKWFHIIVVLLFMFGFGQIVPPFLMVTDVGVKVIGVFLGIVYGWGTCGLLWPSLLAMVALGATGLLTISQAVSTAMGNPMILFMIMMLVIVENMTETGFINNISVWLVTRSICKGRPWVMASCIFATAYFVAAFANAFPAIFLCWGFWYSIFKAVGYEKYDKFVTCALTGTIFAVILGSISVPFHNLPLVLLGSFATMTQSATVSFGAYMGVTVPFSLCCMLEFIFVCKYIFKADAEKLKTFDPMDLTGGKELIFTKKQVVSASCLGVVMFLLFISSVLPAGSFLKTLLDNLGLAGVGIIIVVVMSWIKIDGEPLLEFAKTARKAVPWDIILFIAMILVISSVITNEATGITALLGWAFNALFVGKSIFMVTVLCAVCAIVMTNFMNNTVTAFLFLNITAAYTPVLLAQNINPWVMVTLIIISANLAFWTPVASSTAGMLYGNTEWLRQRDIFKLSLVTSLFWIATLLTVGYGLAMLLY